MAQPQKVYQGVVEADALIDLAREERVATDAIAQWTARQKELRAQIEAALGDNEAGTIGGVPALFHAWKDQWATQRLIKENPTLAAVFTREVTVEQFDMDLFRAAYPEVARQYQVRAFRSEVKV